MTWKTLLLTGATVAAMAAPAGANDYFLRTSGETGHDRVRAVAEIDGRIFFAGVQDLTFASSTGLLVATEGDGTVLFERAFGDLFETSISIDALVADSGRLFAGGTVSSSTTTGTAFVAELDVDGGIVWQRALRGSDESSVAGLIATRDGGLLVVGSVFPAGQTFRDGWVAKLDGAGAIEWQLQLGTRGSDGLAAAVEREEGGYVLAGGIGSDRDPTGTLNGWLVALDAGGNLLWQRAYGANVGDSFSSVALTRGSILAFGATCGFCFFGPDGWIVEADLSGGLEQSLFLGDFEFPGADSIEGAAPLSQGSGFVLFGSTDTIAGRSQQMFAARIDDRARVRWMRQIGTERFDVGYDVGALSRGDFAYGGYAVSADDGHQAFFGTLDKNGRALDACDAVSEISIPLRASTMSTATPATAAVSVPDVASGEGTLVELDDAPAPSTTVCVD